MVSACVVGIPCGKPLYGQRPILQKLGRQRSRIRIGNDLVVVAVHVEHGHADLLEIVGEISLRKSDDPVVVRFRAAHHALAPPVLDFGLRRLGARPVAAIEGTCCHIAIESRAIGGECRLKSIED